MALWFVVYPAGFDEYSRVVEVGINMGGVQVLCRLVRCQVVKAKPDQAIPFENQGFQRFSAQSLHSLRPQAVGYSIGYSRFFLHCN